MRRFGHGEMAMIVKRGLVYSMLCVLLLSAFPGVAQPADAEPTSTTDNQTVTFSVDRPDLWFEASFPMSVTWTDQFIASENDALSVSYTLAPQPASVEITVPLSDYLGWLGIDDVMIPVPLGDTLLGTSSISLTSLAGIPSWAASLDLRLTGSIKMSDLYCSSGSAFVQTAASTLIWSGWTTKTAQVVASETPGGTVRATFSYALGIGLTLSVLGADVIDIISSTVINAIGVPFLETEIEVPAPAGVLSVAVIGVLVVSAIVVCAVILIMLGRKRGGASVTTAPEETTPESPLEGVPAEE